MKEKIVKTPADSRYTLTEIVDPIYISREQLEDMRYIPDNIRSRLVIVDFVKEEEN